MEGYEEVLLKCFSTGPSITVKNKIITIQPIFGTFLIKVIPNVTFLMGGIRIFSM
jgi:hypothetical protein